MKKALIALYVIVAVQMVLAAFAFYASHNLIKTYFVEAGIEMLGICDNRYVHQQR